MGGVMSPCLRPAPPAQAPASSLGCAGRFLCFGGNRAGRGNVPCVGQGTGLQRAWSPGRGLQRGPQVMRVDTGIQMGAAPPGAPSSPGCPQLPRVPPSPSGPHLPWVLRLWSRHRAGEACRGQQVPARRARGGQSRAVSLNAPRRARRRGGRAWPSPGMGTLLGGGSPHCGRLLCHRCGQHPRASPQGTAKGPGLCTPGVSWTVPRDGGRGGAMPGDTGAAVVLSGYLQEENASKNHLLTPKLTSPRRIALPAGRHQREKQRWGGEIKTRLFFSFCRNSSSRVLGAPRGEAAASCRRGGCEQ